MSTRFLLDTDTVSFALHGQGGVGDTIRDRRPSELAISAITVGELRYGAEKRGARRITHQIDAFVTDVVVLPFDADAADHFGRLAAALATRGAQIGALDTMIAGHALAVGATLVTHNGRHFDRVRGLKTADWY